ncbi:myoneurin [Ixodes scapularis]|nr:myoneurin [Ixodes scapularis]
MIPSTARKAVNGAGMDEGNRAREFGSVPLLDMLAEVASATLKSDPNLHKDPPQKLRKATLQADALTLDQIRILSDRMLLDMFSELTSNEMRRTFSYRCYLMPSACAETFSSFGNENRARLQMKAHLLAHIAKLLTEANAPGRLGKVPFTAEPIQARRKRLQGTDTGTRRRKRSQVKKGPSQLASTKGDRRRPHQSPHPQPPATPGQVKPKSKPHSKPQVNLQAKLHTKPHSKLHSKPAKPNAKLLSKPHTKLQVKILSKPDGKMAAKPGKPKPKPSSSSESSSACNGDVMSERQWEEHPGAAVVRMDHAYWGTVRTTCEEDEGSDLEEWCGDRAERRGPVPCQAVIATPPFPYVYVPLLPNTSSVVEVADPVRHPRWRREGQRRRARASTSEDDEDEEEEEEEEGEEEEEEEEEEDDDEENEEERHPKAKSRPHGRRTARPSAETDVERRLALKHIRALRAKRKDERGPLVCKICKTKVFTAQATLMYHYRSHAGIKPFNCKICEATFTRQHSLNYHMLIHNNKSRFACEDCGRHFRHPSHFKEHLRRHTGETPYQCTDCSQRFKTRNTYKRHLKTRHGKILTAQGILSLGEARSSKLAATCT